MQWGEKYTKMRSYTARKFIARKHFYKIAKILLQIEGVPVISRLILNILICMMCYTEYEITVFTQTYLIQHCNSHFN